jgi:hypothetical protein
VGIRERAARAAAPHLEPGERVAFACGCQQKGMANTAALTGVVGYLATSGIRKRREASAAAAGFPLAATMILAVTDRRLLAITGRKLLGTVEPSALAGARVKKKNAISAWQVEVALVNGYAVTLEVSRLAGPAELVEAINGLVAVSPTV